MKRILTAALLMGLMLAPLVPVFAKEPVKTPVIDESDFKLSKTGLKWRDDIVGSGPMAQPGNSVTVNYVGVLYPGGEKFDSSLDRGEPFVFKLGMGQVIPGWDKGVSGMKVGGMRTLIIPPELAYGNSGVPGAIPPKATLKFQVQLLGVK